MMVASRPVLNSEAEGPIHGSVIMGKFLTEKVVQKLADQTNVDFKIWDLNQGSISAGQRSIANNITRQSAFHILEVDDNSLEVRTVFNDLKGNSALLMEAKINRDISAKGAAAVKYSLVSIVCAGLFILTVLLVLLQRGVIGPITRLTNHFVAVGQSDNLTTRLSLDRSDEIGTMGKEFDNMVSKLSDARKKLMDQSYTSGMAEMASGLLHNVRNTLTPVTVEIETLSQTINNAPLEQIEMARKELAEGDPDSERKEDLRKFLDAGNKSLVEMVQDMQGKLQNVSTPVAQIERMLAEGDAVSHAQRPVEIFKLDELVNDTIALLPGDLKTAALIELDQSVTEVTLKTNRISLLQIINNLLINAAESIQQSGTTSGKIEIGANTEEVNGSETVHVTVRDNGSGIEQDNIERIFERGFSTKQAGHSGLGLHWCANTLIAANGRIYAESQGSGQGACLHVMIPNNL
jgi:signal transduction histidine kinase